MLTCTTFQDLRQTDGYFTVTTDAADIRIYFLSDDIIRVRASFDKLFREESYLLAMTGWPDRMDSLLESERRRVPLLQPSVRQEDDRVVFSTATVDLILHKSPLAIRLCDKDGGELFSDLPGKAYQRDHLGRITHYKKMSPNDCYYGFGEKSGDINKNGRYMRFSPKDSMGYNPSSGDPLYKHIPTYIRLDSDSGKAVGVFYHNTYEAAMSMGDEISGYWPRYTYYTADGGDIDYFLINGPKIRDIVRRYTDLTGKTVMQPRHSLGYIGSTMFYTELPQDSDDALLSFVDKAQSEDIPISGFLLSSGYTSKPNERRCVFTWNRKRFPDPESFFRRMSERGVAVAPNVKPGVLLEHPLYDEMEQKGCFVRTPDGKAPQRATWWGGPGVYFDFTNPIARQAWADYLVENVLKTGAIAVWNDNCEYDGIDDREALCSFEGESGTLGCLKSVQPNLMSRATHTAAQKLDANLRPYVICRSGSAGIQRYAQTWAGDNSTSFETLRYNIATLLGLGLSGVANTGTDIGGFHGPAPGPELLVRWVQHGIFQPRFSIHSCNTDNTVTEPWMYHDCTAYIRDAIRFRYRLIPYLYSLLWHSSQQGEPIMRPLFYEFQDDTACYQEGVDFLLGSSLLVATVVEEGASERRVYLPAGCRWYDFYTRSVYEGGQTLRLPVDMGSIPLFVREGSVLPLAPFPSSPRMEPLTCLTLLITPRQPAEFTLYEDDGVSNAYKNGEYALTRIRATPGVQVRIDIDRTGSYASEIESIVLDIVSREKGPYWVTVDGQPIEQFLHREKWEDAAEGWYYSHTLKSVQVKTPAGPASRSVVVSFESFDMIRI